MKAKDMKKSEAGNGSSIVAGGGAVSPARLEAAERLERAADLLRKKTTSVHEELNESTHNVEERVKRGAEDAGDLARRALDKANDAANAAADSLDATGSFILKNDLSDIRKKAKEGIANHPEAALAAVGAGGLIGGYLIAKKLL